MIHVFLFIAFFSSSNLSFAGGGDSVGNGGDGIRILFSQARDEAIRVISNLNRCSFADEISLEAKEWILENKENLIDDLRHTSQLWTEDFEQPTCAYTYRVPQSPIHFSFKKCRTEIYTLEIAAMLLVHETVHHFGFQDETFADEVGRAVLTSHSAPYCMGSDPFSIPNCHGLKGLNANEPFVRIPSSERQVTSVANDDAPAIRMKIGQYRMFSRQRTCKDKDNCGEWIVDKSLIRRFTDRSGHEKSFMIVGDIWVFTPMNGEKLFFTTIGDRSCLAEDTKCTPGVKGAGWSDLFEQINGINQKIIFSSSFTGRCLHQSAKLKFPSLRDSTWLEVEHVVFGPY